MDLLAGVKSRCDRERRAAVRGHAVVRAAHMRNAGERMETEIHVLPPGALTECEAAQSLQLRMTEVISVCSKRPGKINHQAELGTWACEQPKGARVGQVESVRDERRHRVLEDQR